MRLPRQLHPRPSRFGLGLLGGLHLVALLAIAASAYAGAAIFIWSGALAAFILSLAWSAWSLRRAPHALRLGREGQLHVRLGRDDTWRPVRLLGETAVWEFAVILRCRLEGREGVGAERLGRTLLIGRDSLPPDDFRALSVWLRWRECGKRGGKPGKADGLPR